ncbi:unnamed protein product [Caenorhabditis auriculariae]|uniref:Uncharacterized protein n=1 Tax=Caenorhabditis auriculariae TaxID=2777116 RepID=A0A8S1HKA7_9PELO|nr:unnamed protein product [Caenorhabditis auriculariae]
MKRRRRRSRVNILAFRNHALFCPLDDRSFLFAVARWDFEQIDAILKLDLSFEQIDLILKLDLSFEQIDH